MNFISFKCDYCGKESSKYSGHVNRARKIKAGLYCDRKCAGLGRRNNKSVQEKKEEKRAYDLEYRKKNKEKIKQRAKEYNESPAGRLVQKKQREKQKKSGYRKAYLSTEKYKEYKRGYDQKYWSKKKYGEFWEAGIILNKIDSELDRHETRLSKGTYNKSIKRKRNYEKFKREELERSTLGNPK